MENVYRVEGEDRALALWEIVSVVASVLIAEWVVFALAGDSAWALLFPVATVVAFMLLSHRVRGESARAVGWRLDNFWAAARLLAIPMIVCGALLVGVGLYTSHLDFMRWEGGQSLFGVPALSLLWGPLQQYALQGFINRRAQLVWGRGCRASLSSLRSSRYYTCRTPGSPSPHSRADCSGLGSTSAPRTYSRSASRTA